MTAPASSFSMANATDSAGNRVFIGDPSLNPGFPPPASSAPTAPTIAAAYGSIPQADQDVNAGAAFYKGIATTPVDEAGIRKGVMDRLQAEIDATNQVFNEKLAQAKQTGANLLGSTVAANA